MTSGKHPGSVDDVVNAVEVAVSDLDISELSDDALSDSLIVDEIGERVREEAFWAGISSAINSQIIYEEEKAVEYRSLLQRLQSQHGDVFTDRIFVAVIVQNYFCRLRRRVGGVSSKDLAKCIVGDLQYWLREMLTKSRPKAT